jgi:hypothetical protein
MNSVQPPQRSTPTNGEQTNLRDEMRNDGQTITQEVWEWLISIQEEVLQLDLENDLFVRRGARRSQRICHVLSCLFFVRFVKPGLIFYRE